MTPLSFAESITIQTNNEQFSSGDIVSIDGQVSGGNTGDFVALEIKNPSGETILIRTVTLGDGGSFDLKFKIPESGESGSYDIVANAQLGGQTITETKTISKTNTQSTSSNTSSKEGGGCLIATATYGSELSPQVQLLREIRDNQLLNTESGTAFMSTFNDIYYSFSPIIADYERENPYFKEAVKIAITPMISSLSLMENAESESEVLGIGISVIMLN
ncbi:MAG: hypothetical protein HPQ69_07040, partial [Marine Group I thaumarchaeote]